MRHGDIRFGQLNQTMDNMHKVIARMREYATGILEARNIRIHFQVEEKIKRFKR